MGLSIAKMNVKWILVTFCLVASVFFRFSHVDQKILWYDEHSTLVTVSGFTEAEIVQSIAQVEGRLTPNELLQYLKINERSSISRTVRRLILENPQHPPFYYMAAHLWGKFVGDSSFSQRILTTLFSLLIFPAFYWFLLELYRSTRIAQIGLMLVAASPIYLVYAHEIRQYILLALLVMLGNAAFLRLNRTHSFGSWILFVTFSTLGLYTHLYYALVILTQITYWIFFVSLKCKNSSAFGVIAILFSPWIYVILERKSEIDRIMYWTSKWKIPDSSLVLIWLENLKRIFIDVGQPESPSEYSVSHPAVTTTLYVLYASIVLLLLLSVCVAKKKAEKRAFAFSFLFLLCTFVPIVLPDLLYGGQRSAPTRYFLPFYVSVQIVVSFLLGHVAQSRVLRRAQHILLMLLIVAGFYSMLMYSKERIWWNKFLDLEVLQVSDTINKNDNPLLISNDHIWYALSLSHHVREDTLFLLTPRCSNCTLKPRGDMVLASMLVEEERRRLIYKVHPDTYWMRQLYKQKNDHQIKTLYSGRSWKLWQVDSP